MGEALFDVFPDETRLGGAPLNLALHAHQLGNDGTIVSRIGQDDLGRRLLEELARREMSDDHLQTDPDHPTGTVLIDFDAEGEPTYDIIEQVAWDYLQWDGDLDDLARHCDAVAFGTLAQRTAQTRNNIYRFLGEARRAVKLLDVNLRQDYYDRRGITRSLELVDAVKANRMEVERLGQLLGLEGDPADVAGRLIGQFDLKWLAVTAGAEGVTVFTPDGRAHSGPTRPAEADGNPVGAGDACAAALLHGVVRRWPWDRTIELANRLGGYVASQPGACPDLPEELLKLAGVEIPPPPPEAESEEEEAGAETQSPESNTSDEEST